MDQYASGRHKRVSAKAIIRTEDGHILIVKDHWKDYWSFPGGIVEANESPFEGVQREVLEETSLTPEWVGFLGSSYRRDEKKESLNFTFGASMSRTDVEENFKAADGEGEAWKLVTPEEAMTLLEKPTAGNLPQFLARWENCSLLIEAL
ncbi:MAG TPA: NUDIX hydrolase [Verrucomicrobiae bacterium]|nr:NUDIX hydrolase [Verrucomicrobiae bacterium]